MAKQQYDAPIKDIQIKVLLWIVVSLFGFMSGIGVCLVQYVSGMAKDVNGMKTAIEVIKNQGINNEKKFVYYDDKIKEIESRLQ